MTEDEAKTKYCCGPQVLGVAQASVNSGPLTPVASGFSGRCIASACMGWRWRGAHQENSFAPERPEGDDWQPGAARNPTWWWRTIPKDTTGFCGLAGEPS